MNIEVNEHLERRIRTLIQRKPEVMKVFQDYQWHRCTDETCKQIVQSQMLDILVGISALEQLFR